MLRKLSFSGPLLIIVAALLWAFDGLIRQHLYSLPPITIIFFEHLIGLFILLPFALPYVFKAKIEKKEWWLIVLLSVLSGVLGTLWFTTALGKVNYISLSVVFLLQKLQPLFAISTAIFFLKEKFEKKYLIWAPVAIIAAFLVTFKNGIVDLSTGEGTAIAALYALGAAFAWGSSTTFSKMLLTKVRSEVSMFYRFVFTLVLSFILLVTFGHSASLFEPTLSQLGFFALIGISTGMVALLIYYKGLAKTSVHISTILELTFPFIAIFIDMKVNHTTLSLTQWLAAFVLVFSIYQIARLRESQA
ncbi:MAG: EamA family transporter [Candidatus Pacebacteria bacterium]|nr:EamA family transporter [Candidatus Paceibacterota bacterium]